MRLSLAMLESLDEAPVGSGAWWSAIARRGTPLVDASDEGRVRLTFLWRDALGDEARSSLQRVYIDLNSITDHHSLTPETLQRIPASDVWWWCVEVAADWRGSYCFIPIGAEHLPPSVEGDAGQRRRQQRQWWCSLLDLAEADPFNRATPHASSRGHPLSAVHLPQAPSQWAWRAVDERAMPGSGRRPPHGQLQRISWVSRRLGNRRAVWIYATPGGAEGAAALARRPLVLLLDGHYWATAMPIYPALDVLTEMGRLVPAVFVLIDALDLHTRAQELPCNRVFWEALQAELLPAVAAVAPCSTDPARTVVAGQSFGGLAAMYAALHWPQRFGCVLSQSGSFWWPKVELLGREIDCRAGEAPLGGWLVEQVEKGLGSQSRLAVFLESGLREAAISASNRRLGNALRAAGHRLETRLFQGGHDAICWRGGLLDGLVRLLGGVTGDDAVRSGNAAPFIELKPGTGSGDQQVRQR